MEEYDFIIGSSIKKPMSKKKVIYYIIANVVLMIMSGLIFYPDFRMIYTMIFSIIFGQAVGLVVTELFKKKISINISQNTLLIKRSFERNVKIDLKSVKGIDFDADKVLVYFNDYVKTLDLTWLSNDQYQKLKERLSLFF
jgi:uncharacterized membrane-anchored protein YitT (DUF2179 family)